MIACDWNEHAITAIQRNLKKNKIPKQKCEVLYGDNRITAPSNIADRVNLGLIPTSKDSWGTALKCLKKVSGVGSMSMKMSIRLLIQMMKGKLMNAGHECAKELQDLCKGDFKCTCRHVENVKSYAPHIYHVVFDIECRPFVNQ